MSLPLLEHKILFLVKLIDKIKLTMHTKQVELRTYYELEIQSLILDSRAFIVLHFYNNDETYLINMKTQLKLIGYTLYKFPTINWKITDNTFIKRALWLPINNNLYIAVANYDIALAKYLPVFDSIEKNGSSVLLSRSKTLFIDRSRKRFIEESIYSFETPFSNRYYLQRSVCSVQSSVFLNKFLNLLQKIKQTKDL